MPERKEIRSKLVSCQASVQIRLHAVPPALDRLLNSSTTAAKTTWRAGPTKSIHDPLPPTTCQRIRGSSIGVTLAQGTDGFAPCSVYNADVLSLRLHGLADAVATYSDEVKRDWPTTRARKQRSCTELQD